MACPLARVGFTFLVLSLAARGLALPTVVDPDLRVQTWTRSLDSPTGVAILPGGGGTLLVTEKNTGRVRVVDNKRIVGTALDLAVANQSERGLLGIATPPDFSSNNHVYVYYTAAASDGGDPIEHRIERYTWNAGARSLSFDRRIKTLPGGPGPNHDGGKITFGPDGKLYAVIGDLNRDERTTNSANDTVNRIGVILRMNPSGSALTNNPFFNAASPGSPLSDVYAYGVRNSFGLAFDPKTNALWDTENGPSSMDEINRVRPGFNSGWDRIMGPDARDADDTADLVSLGDAARYDDPTFSWAEPIAPTDLEFINTGRLGGEYNGDLFVGDVRTGRLHRFELTRTRNAFSLGGDLADRVADNDSGDLLAEQDQLFFGDGFGVISDLTVAPGG